MGIKEKVKKCLEIKKKDESAKEKLGSKEDKILKPILHHLQGDMKLYSGKKKIGGGKIIKIPAKQFKGKFFPIGDGTIIEGGLVLPKGYEPLTCVVECFQDESFVVIPTDDDQGNSRIPKVLKKNEKYSLFSNSPKDEIVNGNQEYDEENSDLPQIIPAKKMEIRFLVDKNGNLNIEANETISNNNPGGKRLKQMNSNEEKPLPINNNKGEILRSDKIYSTAVGENEQVNIFTVKARNPLFKVMYDGKGNLCYLNQKEQLIPLTKEWQTVGREMDKSDSKKIVYEGNKKMSRQHCKIRKNPKSGNFEIKDTKSNNGTYVKVES